MFRRRSLQQRVSNSFRVITELDLSHRYEVQAGTIALVILGLLALVGLVLSGWPRAEGGDVSVVVEFDDSRGVSVGDQVLVAGVPVGRVISVDLQEPGRVLVTLAVVARERPHRDAGAEIVALNLVGKHAVSYRPGTAPALLPADTLVRGTNADELTKHLTQVREEGATLFRRVERFATPEFARDLAGARAATAKAMRALKAVPADSVGRTLERSLLATHGVLVGLDSLAALVRAESLPVQAETLSGSLGDLIAGLGASEEALTNVRARIDSGQGTVGRLVQDSALQRELNATRRSVDLLLWKYLRRRPRAEREGGS
jgi:phospholipid/cholesterol/gamma-HCH transport system substrate-binding protein